MVKHATLLAAVLLACPAWAQSSRGRAEITMNGTRMTIEYGRPSLRGRDMEGNTPVGHVWRLGADEATTLTLTGPAVFGNMVVSKGSYSLFAKKVSEDEWFLIVNSETGEWGNERNPAKDLMAIPLKWEKDQEPADVLEIALSPEAPDGDTGILSIRWGTDVLKQRFRLPKTS